MMDHAQPAQRTQRAAAAATGGVDSATADVAPLANQTYAHGAFMGAAGDLVKDPLWSGIFARLMPAEHQHAVGIKTASELMLFMENNPIMAAYGEVRAGALKPKDDKGQAAGPAVGRPTPLEWDVWLDPQEPQDVSKCRIAHGGKMTTVLQALSPDSAVGAGRGDVKGAPGATRWMELFGQAVLLSQGGGGAQDRSADDCKRLTAAGQTDNARQAIELCSQFLRPPGGLILDCKSTYSTPEDINRFITTLKTDYGINVFGIGTFRHDQLKGLQQGVRPVKFYHGVDGIVHAAHESREQKGDAAPLQQGDHVMFNAGSLLQENRQYGLFGKRSYGINQAAFQRFVAVQQEFNLAVGLYVQEPEVDEAAVEIITKLVNSRPGLFRDGFAYGNVKGKAEVKTDGTGLGAQGSTAALEKASTMIDHVKDLF